MNHNCHNIPFHTMSKYINPFTDVGFKRIFGQEINKDILIDFLNALLEGEKHVVDLKFLDKELLPLTSDDRSLIYDIYCTTDSGDHFIVEMQNKYQAHFRQRALYYAAADIARQGIRGSGWDYEIVPVYGVYFMNFTWRDEDMNGRMRSDVILADKATHRQFSDLLRLIFIQLPLMTKEEYECDNDFERWIYVLKNMESFERMPFAAQKAVFDRLGSIAEIAAMPEPQRTQYEQSLKVYRDTLSILRTERAEGRAEGIVEGRAEGRAEGIVEGRAEVAKKMKDGGLDYNSISNYTGLAIDEIARL